MRLHRYALWLLLLMPLLAGCKASARAALFILDAWDTGSSDAEREERKRQRDLIELNRQIDEADPSR